MSGSRLLIPLLGLRPAATSSVVYVRNVVPLVSRAWGADAVAALVDDHGRRQIEGFQGRLIVREVADPRIARLLALRKHLPAAESEVAPDVIFVPEGQIHGARLRAPVVMTLHHHLNFSRPGGQPLGRRLYWWLWHDRDIRRSCERSAALIAPTTVFAEEFATYVPAARDRIEVVHHGVSGAFRPPVAGEEAATPCVLAVANAHVYKNLAGALRIFARACEGLPHELRVAGVDDAALRAVAQAAGVAGSVMERVKAMGLLGEARLATHYRQASALLFPSLVESFGLPVAEAMASACPVVAADLPALREVTAGAAVLVAPEDEGSLADALRGVLTDGRQAAALRAAGLERARGLTWAENARRVTALLRRVATG